MKIGYIKLDKPQKNAFLYEIRNFFNIVRRDKYDKENYYISNTKDKSKKKLINILLKDEIDYILEENGLNINYPKLTGKYALKYMLPEVVQYCAKLIQLKVEEIFICVNEYTNENCKIIRELTSKVKVVNIISNNKRYLLLEKELEKNGIYITVNNNKRKSLKRANIVINMDFKDIDEYIINKNMIIIDVTSHLYLKKGFSGIYIKEIIIDTEKIKRIFSEYENFQKNELIESEMIKINDYDNIRIYIEMNKFKILKVIGNRVINNEEFKRIGKIAEKG